MKMHEVESSRSLKTLIKQIKKYTIQPVFMKSLNKTETAIFLM